MGTISTVISFIKVQGGKPTVASTVTFSVIGSFVLVSGACYYFCTMIFPKREGRNEITETDVPWEKGSWGVLQESFPLNVIIGGWDRVVALAARIW